MELTLASGDEIGGRFFREYEKIYEAFEIRDVMVGLGTYPMWSREVGFRSDESRHIFAGMSYEDSDYWGGKRKDIRMEGGFRPFANLNLEWEYNFSRVKHPTARFNSNILSNRIVYAFTTDMYVKSYLQWNELDKRVSANFLFNYRYKAGSDFYLVYNEIWDSEERYDIGVRDRVLLLKFTYLLRV